MSVCCTEWVRTDNNRYAILYNPKIVLTNSRSGFQSGPYNEKLYIVKIYWYHAWHDQINGDLNAAAEMVDSITFTSNSNTNNLILLTCCRQVISSLV